MLLVYTRYYSSPTAVLCTGNITLFAHTVRSTTTDFRISQYSSTHISYFLPGIFHFLVVVKHSTLFVYTRYSTKYILPYILEYYNFIHTWYIYTWYQVYTYSSIRVNLVSYDVYTRYAIDYQLFIWYVCDRRIPGSWYDKPCLRELSNQEMAVLLHVHFLTPNREQTVMNRTKP